MVVFPIAQVFDVTITDVRFEFSPTVRGHIAIRWTENGRGFSDFLEYANMVERKQALAEAFTLASTCIKDSEF